MCKYVFIVYNIILICSVLGNTEVETTHGKISGKKFKTIIKRKEYFGFMGIPYATPPLKTLRFKAPESIDPWTNVLNAKKEKPACIQFNTNIIKAKSIGRYGVEDCLYLDIFTPAIDKNKRAVVVFLYNERFQNSYNKTNDYGPDFFIEENIVVVTISHRLSLFGFLSFEDDILPGNAGLQDIVVAMEWVVSNVEYFGGDPKRITLLGSQGGAVAVDLLLHSKARKLFNSAILQSGTSLSSMYLHEKARDRAFQLGKLSNIFTANKVKLLQELNGIAAPDLLAKETKASPVEYYKENQKSVLSFGPIVQHYSDGIVTEYPENSLESVNIPIMIGLNSREGLAPALHYLEEPKYLRFAQQDFPFLLPLRLKFKFDPESESYFNAVEEIKRYYFSKGPITEKSVSDYISYMGDVLSSYPIDRMTRQYSNISSKPVFYYLFDYYSDLNENKNNILKLSVVEEGTWGAATGDELCYLFKCPDLKEKYAYHDRKKSEEMVMQRSLTKMWANFAKYGNPTPIEDNSLNGIKWPPYNIADKKYLYIGKEIKIKSHLFKDNFEFWDRFIKKWETKFKKGVMGNINIKCEL